MTEKENTELPMVFSKEGYDKIMIALYNAKAYEKEISRQIIADTTGYVKNNISTAFTFLRSIKAIEKKGKSVILSEIGAEYAKNVALELGEDAKLNLNKLLRNSVITQKIVQFLKINKNKSNEELKKKIISFSNKAINLKSENAASTFLEMMFYSNLIKIEDGFTLIIEQKEENLQIVTESPKIKSKTIIASKTKLQGLDSIVLQINLNINFDSNIDSGDIIKLISKLDEEIKNLRS